MTEAMPTWEGFLIPTLKAMEDGKTRHRREIPPVVADSLNLTNEQRQVLIASGQPMYADRIGWGLSFCLTLGHFSLSLFRSMTVENMLLKVSW